MTVRRDVHGCGGTHDSCPDPAHCICECTTCKRAWQAAGRPKPTANPPDPEQPARVTKEFYLNVVKGNPDALEVLAARCADLTWAHEQTRNALDSSRAQCDALKDQLRDAEQALRDVAECFESLDRLKEAAEKVRG